MNAVTPLLAIFVLLPLCSCQAPTLTKRFKSINPCTFRRCSSTTECRLQKVDCFTTPCYPTSVCHPKLVSQGECEIGKPVVIADGDDLVCSSDDAAVCPDGTFCRKGKCCYGNNVQEQKAGVCPRSPPNNLITTCDVLCNGDNECPGTEKCCSQGCSIRCTQPIISLPPPVIKPGRCPRPFRAGCGAPCKRDGDCRGNSKCCRTTACRGRRCINEPVIKPSPPFVNPCSFTRCSSTTECRLLQVTCFKAPCYPTAVCHPKLVSQGECEIGRPVVIADGDDLVCSSDDAVCPDGTFCRKGKCCYGNNVQAQNKAGVCPKPPPNNLVTTCDVLCSGDNECPGTEKCCSQGCSIRCTQPFISLPPPVIKPGRCPRSFRAGCGAPCKRDGDCRGNSKCCRTRACRGRRCINPTRLCPFYNPRCYFRFFRRTSNAADN